MHNDDTSIAAASKSDYGTLARSDYRRKQCPGSYPCPRRCLYVWTNASYMGRCYHWISVCLCAGESDWKSTFLSACLPGVRPSKESPYVIRKRDHLCNRGNYVSVHEFSGCMVLLSVLQWISHIDLTCKLAETYMLQFPFCILFPDVFHPAFCKGYF